MYIINMFIFLQTSSSCQSELPVLFWSLLSLLQVFLVSVEQCDSWLSNKEAFLANQDLGVQSILYTKLLCVEVCPHKVPLCSRRAQWPRWRLC